MFFVDFVNSAKRTLNFNLSVITLIYYNRVLYARADYSF